MRWPRSFKEANDRRHALIDTGMERELTREEKRGWVLVDTMVGAWIDYRHPFDDSKLEGLEEMVARLERGMSAAPRVEAE